MHLSLERSWYSTETIPEFTWNELKPRKSTSHNQDELSHQLCPEAPLISTHCWWSAHGWWCISIVLCCHSGDCKRGPILRPWTGNRGNRYLTYMIGTSSLVIGNSEYCTRDDSTSSSIYNKYVVSTSARVFDLLQVLTQGALGHGCRYLVNITV